MAVSRSSDIIKLYANHLLTTCILSSPGNRCLWHAFLDLGLGYVRHLRNMSRRAREHSLNVFGLPRFGPFYPQMSAARSHRSSDAVLLMRHPSFLPILRSTSLHFSFANSLKSLARSSILPGSPNSVCMWAEYAQFKQHSSKLVVYEACALWRGFNI